MSKILTPIISTTSIHPSNLYLLSSYYVQDIVLSVSGEELWAHQTELEKISRETVKRPWNGYFHTTSRSP